MYQKPILARGGRQGVAGHWHRSRVVRILAGLLGALLLAWSVLYITRGRFLKTPFERIASRLLERRVDVAGDFQLYLDPITIRFVAQGLSISNPDWAGPTPFFAVRHIDSRIATLPLIVGTRRVNRLLLDGGRLDLRWDRAGRRNTWTFGTEQPARPLELPTIRQALLSDTRLHYGDPRLQLEADIGFQPIRARGTRLAESITFAGDGRLRGRGFALSGRLLSPNQTVEGGRNRFVLRAASGADRLGVAGTLPGATEIEGADLRVAARGANLARLFDFLGVAIPDTRSYRLDSHLVKTGGTWRFTRMRGGFGNSDLAGRMAISMPGDRLRIDAVLQSRQVDIVDLGPFIGYRPGTRTPVHMVGGTPRVLPDAPLRSETLALFDAHLDYRVKDIRAPNLPVSNVALTLDLRRSLLKLSPLSFDVARGHLASDIVIDARRRPVITDYDIRLAPTPMGRLLAGWGVEESGTTGVIRARARLRGSGDSVHESLGTADGRIAVVLPRGTMWTRNIQLSELDIGTFVTKMFARKLQKPVEINCGLIAFTVRQGGAVADPILIDTTRNVVTGKGGFRFGDESLDLALRADAKTFSLFSGQSPVGLRGHFAAPRLQVVTPELLARAGTGLGLAMATPLAGILAFVDPGDAKAADCGPVLAGARAGLQRTSKGKPRKDLR